jgi:pyruvate formate lyase activating enzyme
MTVRAAPRPALWFDTREDGRIACRLCPHNCVIQDNHPGKCGVRFNHGGTLDIPYYGMSSNVAMDPIEKKPLYHYHPGEPILSIGFVGCSFRCGFCQNWHISQGRDARTRFIEPKALVDAAKREGSFAIAYTYSEPLVHAEYVLDTAALARAAGLKNVLVSNGWLNEAPASEVLGLIDAANIDLKGFTDEFYRSETGGRLGEVKRFITQAAAKIHLEVTTLVIPGKNDSPSEIEALSSWLASVATAAGRDIPLHLSAYHPDYKYTIPATSASALHSLAEVARRHLPWVYTGNIGPEESPTLCAGCANVLVQRHGYSVRVTGLRGDACSKCGRKSPIKFE